jgi:hypothetical protein
LEQLNSLILSLRHSAGPHKQPENFQENKIVIGVVLCQSR